MWSVVFHPEAQAELSALVAREQAAALHAVEKLKALGSQLPFPHQSHVEGGEGVRELRPRAGRSRWRLFYGQIGEVFVIAAVGPEAQVDRRGFDRAVADATARLAEIESDEEEAGDEAQ